MDTCGFVGRGGDAWCSNGTKKSIVHLFLLPRPSTLVATGTVISIFTLSAFSPEIYLKRRINISFLVSLVRVSPKIEIQI